MSLPRLIFSSVLLAAAGAASGQGVTAVAASPPAYDVVSVKPNKTGSGSQRVSVTNRRYFGQNVGVRVLLSDAYGLKQELIFGIPKSVDDERFDVDAKVVEQDSLPKDLTGSQRQAMLRPVLAERFAVKAHTEIRILPIYELIALPGRRKMKAPAGALANHDVNIRRREFDSRETTVATLADALSNKLHVPVVDKTGLTGSYDIDLKWSLEDDPPVAAAAPSIFTALEEQLGLKLRSAKGPAEVLVVDRVEEPTEN